MRLCIYFTAACPSVSHPIDVLSFFFFFALAALKFNMIPKSIGKGLRLNSSIASLSTWYYLKKKSNESGRVSIE